jgi:protein SCO1
MEEGLDCWELKIVSMYRTVFSAINLLVLALVFQGCKNEHAVQPLPYYNDPDFSPQFLSAADAKNKIKHTIPPFSFTDQNGNLITEKNIDHKLHVANFIFTSCGNICPVITRHMKLVQDSFKNNQQVVILSFSVTPWIDNVSRLKQYAENNGILNNWHLLTGEKAKIYQLARQSYFAEEDLGFTKDSTEFLHTEHILLVDRTKRIRGIYNGTLQLEIEQMIKDIKVLLSE